MDEGAVKQVFLESLSGGTGAEKVMGMAWKNAGILKIERRTPPRRLRARSFTFSSDASISTAIRF